MNIWQYLEIAGVAIGILYLYFEYKASVWLWLTGIVMPAIYIFVYYESGFYADMGINIYYLFAGFYGWAAWVGRSRKQNRLLSSDAMPTLETALALEPATEIDPAFVAERNTNAASYALEATPETYQPYMAGVLESHTSNDAPPVAGVYAVAGDSGVSGDISGLFGVSTISDAFGNSSVSGDAAVAVDVSAPTATGNATETSLPITRMPARFWMPITLVVLAFFAVISYILINFTDSVVPLGDSFTTALSVVGLWMLARKYVEQWLVWIVVDVVCSGLYLYKDLYLTGLLFALYSIVAVFGYFKWLKLMKE